MASSQGGRWTKLAMSPTILFLFLSFRLHRCGKIATFSSQLAEAANSPRHPLSQFDAVRCGPGLALVSGRLGGALALGTGCIACRSFCCSCSSWPRVHSPFCRFTSTASLRFVRRTAGAPDEGLQRASGLRLWPPHHISISNSWTAPGALRTAQMCSQQRTGPAGRSGSPSPSVPLYQQHACGVVLRCSISNCVSISRDADG